MITPDAVEALARALCKVRGVDPDYRHGPKDDCLWFLAMPEARAFLEMQQAAAMVAKGKGLI
jgi:hypothetical protein